MRILIVLLLSLLIGACSNSSNGVDGPLVPGTGSRFVMEVSGNRSDSGSVDTSELTVTVRVADMLFEGKEHVVQFTADTVLVLMAYETNGDLSIYIRKEYVGLCLVDGGWLRLPFSGSGVVTDTLTGQRATFDGEEHSCTVVWKARPAEEQRVLVEGRELTARCVHADLSVFTDSTRIGSPSRGIEFDVLYVPELRYVVREEITSLSYDGDVPDTLGQSCRVLKSYTLQAEQGEE